VGTTTLRTLESLYWLGVKCILKPETKELSLQQWEAYELEEEAGIITVQQSMQALYPHLVNGLLEAETSLMIVPGYPFRMAEGLITNFHQPQSTLLLLVSAFIGEHWKSVYAYALENKFRFLSYGDSSLLWRNDNSE
jgi:S-adenosylmethionine:tRNA ribosyltransferase-isomerase